ncbi:MAG: hypothetical protein GWN79_09520 [Actinobacteria bacterium]|nr:hypothetical protein [Actinomycetota bacterium]NIS31337.1 hypothetical protein [Actinomycetota bacterium]NIT95611.1 hypothetical protein [Actinomycetota bacterium]NIU19304.1 hypothetical protein [Actinomycetota bacterium]NIU66457.1 hypothetical protein [Actinomycetota bacterium]
MRWRVTFRWWAAGSFALALAVRWLVWLRWYRDLELGFTDNLYYHESANLLADGHGFVNPFTYLTDGTLEPTALHPPGFTVYLSIWSLLGLDTPSWHRLAGGLISALVVIPVGLLLRRLFDDRVAVVGMVLAALHPPLWMNDGLLLSESMYVTIAATVLWLAHRVWEEPSVRRVVELTVVLSVGALTRSEPFLLFFLLVLPLLLTHPRLDWRRRVERVALAAVLAMALLAPWVVRNLTTFDDPTFLAVGPGYVLEKGNCDLTYRGEFLGYWHTECDDGSAWPDGDESVIGTAKLERARAYIGDHLGEQPKVVAARVGRVMGLYRPFQSADFDAFFERRVAGHVDAGLVAHYLVLAAAIPGVALWRRRSTLIPLGAVAGTSLLTAAMTFGVARYRVGADVVFVVLAAVGVGGLLDRYRPATTRPEGTP